MARVSDAITERFLNAVEGLFETDPEWSIFDLDGAKEFYEAAGFVPSPESLEVKENG